MKSVEFHPEAEAEFLAAARYYEGQAENLGLDFIAAVERSYQRWRFPRAAIHLGVDFAESWSPAFPTACSIVPVQIASSSWRSLTCAAAPGIGATESE